MKLNESQLKLLISVMESNLPFAKRQIGKLSVDGHSTYWRIWEDLANRLNAIGEINHDKKEYEKVSMQNKIYNFFILRQIEKENLFLVLGFITIAMQR